MRVGMLDLGTVKFPSRAGEHQRAGATAALVRELGDNYGAYHRFLADSLAAVGKPPEPADFETLDDYVRAWQIVQNLVTAEIVLRNCRDYRRTGRGLDRPHDPSTPLLDADNRLVSVE